MKHLSRALAACLALVMLLALLPAGFVSYAENDVQTVCIGKANIDAARTVLGGKAKADAFKQYMFEHLALCETTIDVSQFRIPYESSLNSFHKVLDLLYYSLPEAFHYDKNLSAKVTGQTISAITVSRYYWNASEYAQKLAAMRSAASTLLSGIKGNSALTDAQKILLIHDRLAIHMAYTTANVTTSNHYRYDTAYAGLVDKTGNCQGYAVTFQYLMDVMGIENYYITSASLNHSWNLIYIDGGTPYFVDVAWDDPYWDIPGRVLHKHLLTSTETFRTNHINSKHPTKVYDFEGIPTNNRYDVECFHNSESAFVYLGSGSLLYYVDTRFYDAALKSWNGAYNGGRSYLHDLTKNPSGQMNYWLNNSGGAFDTNFARLAAWGSKLIVTEPHAVYLYDPAANTYTNVYTQSSNYLEPQAIYGMKLVDSTVYLYYNTKSADFTPDQGYNKTVNLTGTSAPVVVSVTGLTASPSSLCLTKGETTTVKVSVTPANATDQVLTWTVADSSKVNVIGGGTNPVVVGLELGTTAITATSSNGKTVRIPVEVICPHTWIEATCTAPKTCSICGATEGTALGHTWSEVTYTWAEDLSACTATRTCSSCGAVETETVTPAVQKIGSVELYTAAFENEAFATQAKEKIEFIWGDADGNGVVNNRDIVRLKNYLANYDDDTQTSTVEIFPGADADGNGVVNNRDIVRLKNYLANYDEETGISSNGTIVYILGPA